MEIRFSHLPTERWFQVSGEAGLKSKSLCLKALLFYHATLLPENLGWNLEAGTKYIIMGIANELVD